MSKDLIRIVGARQHNLKNLTLTIPRDRLVVITGLSGSGKSSLAFDTLFAEGQRKYVESLSAYARQFLDQLQKPEVDYIEGLSPTIAIEQRTAGANPRSLVATTTEIYDYLRLLFAHVGQPHCPESGVPIARQTTSEIVDKILTLPLKTRVMILSPIVKGQKGEFRDVLERMAREGFVRARVDGKFYELASPVHIKLEAKQAHNIEVIVDRLVMDDKIRVRLGDSVETALKWGEGTLLVLHQPSNPAPNEPWVEVLCSNRYISPATGLSYEPLTPKHFSFNAPQGACRVCHGLGQKLVFDEGLVVPDPTKSLDQGAILPWRRGGKRMILYYKSLLRGVVEHYHQNPEVPYRGLPDDFKRVLMRGSGIEEISFNFWRAGKMSAVKRAFEGVLPNLERLYQETDSEFTRNRLKGFMSPQPCDTCRGLRLKPEILAVTIGGLDSPLEPAKVSPASRDPNTLVNATCATAELGVRAFNPILDPATKPISDGIRDADSAISQKQAGQGEAQALSVAAVQQRGRYITTMQGGIEIAGFSIMDFCRLSVTDALAFLDQLVLSDFQRKIAGELLREIRSRLNFMQNVGLGYLTLNRESGSLSGGEAQRIRLATQIGAGLVGVLYILDEPSIGLHQRDNEQLLQTLEGLRDLGNSVLVVEHDEDTIRRADYIIDLGPGAGVRGGELVAAGTLRDIVENAKSLTGKYLRGELTIAVPKRRLKPTRERGWLEVIGASENNLQGIDARFPLGAMTCVTGVSGSGKSTLVDDILRRALFRYWHGSKERPGAHRSIEGLDHLDKAIVIDQTPIGRTPRSNPATYTGMFNHIRDLFAKLPAAKVRGFGAGRFSFNVKGGRCEKCLGDGLIKIEMHFLPPVYVTCEVCLGRRYNRETLEINYKGKNIADVLEMTVDEAVDFFRAVPQIHEPCMTLAEVGLGYIRLGQSATTLSGGEAQRIKLASELSRRSTGRTLYILDEPTTGLHFHDVAKLLEVLFKLRAAGNTLLIIEHNLDVIKNADWILDLGPEGGTGGGRIVAQGTPEEVAECAASHTGRYLKQALNGQANGGGQSVKSAA